MRHHILLGLLASATILFSGCSLLQKNTKAPTKKATATTATAQKGTTQKGTTQKKNQHHTKKRDYTLDSGNYSIIWLNGDSCEQRGATLNLMLSDRKFSSFSGCNLINGSITKVEKANGKLSMDVELQTMKMCADDENKFENDMKKALDEVTDYERINETLVLKNKNKALFYLREAR